jgi:sugar phosphate isomerase/epimerase
MPVDALALALAAAFVHAAWNLLLSGSEDTHSATAVALLTGAIVFAPVAAITWRLEHSAWPYIAASSSLELLYLVLLATAYATAAMGFVYPIARGSAPVLVLVAGGLPGDRDLPGARSRARDAVGALVDDATAAGVVLAIEPMHPIYAADRGVISTLGQALDVAEQFPAAAVGVVVDTFHVWWDPQLDDQVRRAGRGGRIASYQVCDWITPLPPDALLARGMMGDGHIDFPAVTWLVTGAGYGGDVEVEIFNQAIWDADPTEVATRTAKAFDAYVGL